MCIVCDRKREMADLVRELTLCGHDDIAPKFEAFAGHVLANAYDKDPELSRSIKVRMLSLALSFGKGYLPMDRMQFKLRVGAFRLPTDGSSRIRHGMLNAIEELYALYGSRLPWAFYGGYLFMVSRPNLHVAERLPDLKGLLPDDLPWECVDAVWHGLPPCTSLYLHILAVINRHTGTIPQHGCGCNHYLPPLREVGDPRMKVLYPEPEDLRAETEVPVSHMLVAIESLARGLPHALGETDKSLRQHAAVAERRQETDKPRKADPVPA